MYDAIEQPLSQYVDRLFHGINEEETVGRIVSRLHGNRVVTDVLLSIYDEDDLLPIGLAFVIDEIVDEMIDQITHRVSRYSSVTKEDVIEIARELINE